MGILRPMRRRSFLLALRGLPVLLLAAAPAQALVPLVVIVAADSPLKSVSSAELRRLFLHRSDSIQGETLIPFNHPAGMPLRERFDRAMLGMTPAEVGRFWVDRRLRSQPGPPRSVSSPQLLKRLTAKLQGAITYIEADQLDNSVRALNVDGSHYTDSAYALR